MQNVETAEKDLMAEALARVAKRINDPDVNRSNHEKLVDLISKTLNGSLTELGYFPGIVVKLDECHREIDFLRRERQAMGDELNHLRQAYQHVLNEMAKLQAECQSLSHVAQVSASQAAQAAQQVAQVTQAAHARRQSQPSPISPITYSPTHIQHPMVYIPPQVQHRQQVHAPMPEPQRQDLVARQRQPSLPALPTSGPSSRPSTATTPTAHASSPRTATPNSRSAQNSPVVPGVITPLQSPVSYTHLPHAYVPGAQIPTAQLPPTAHELPYSMRGHVSAPVRLPPPAHRSLTSPAMLPPVATNRPPSRPLVRPRSEVIDLTSAEEDGSVAETSSKRPRLEGEKPVEMDPSSSAPQLTVNTRYTAVLPHASALPPISVGDLPVSSTQKTQQTEPQSSSNPAMLSPVVAAPTGGAAMAGETAIATASGAVEQATNPPEPTPDVTAIESVSAEVQPSASASTETTPEEAEEEDAEEVPELDADGRYPVEYCLEQAFDDDPTDPALLWCLMCKCVWPRVHTTPHNVY
ncbi:hypothetical protein BXZ70DRAFT_946798 [Cristinia sonorae]|uniref:Uncharacterized protein n=1 Tax=Cristinia sonorae TaxID=1940300 RepID=A0A8K0UK12_9AGAR|nr:hypothetical protein BXZ70DRAFT_946798 [Cristinia sonorae]